MQHKNMEIEQNLIFNTPNNYNRAYKNTNKLNSKRAFSKKLGFPYLKKKRPLFRIMIKLLGNTIPRATNLHRFPKRELPLVRLRMSRGVFGLTRGALSEIGLVALPLSVGEVVTLVVVEREAELALVAAKVVAHEVWVLGEVDGF